jgi:glycine/D-amino acid oxidase-like deaminating enzyme
MQHRASERRKKMTERHYEHIVVGKGLMGAAAARHLSTHSQSVALIGPDEPPDRTLHAGVFGSHYDEGRITRILDSDRIWALLAQRSIGRYRDIERRSGISYYYEVGHLAIGPSPDGSEDYVARLHAVAKGLGVVYETYEEAALRERFPYLAFEAGSVGLYQPHTAGHVSPRAQVRAQTAVAAQQGATIIRETVHTVRQVNGGVEVSTEEGNTYRGAKALVATGGFSNTKQLLPSPLDLKVYARTIVLAELDNAQVQRLQDMPSIIYRPHAEAERCYILPPIRYPDGKYYVKIGGGPLDLALRSLAELVAWFRSPGDAQEAGHLTNMLLKIIPQLRPVSLHTESCVTSYTRTGYPYADMLEGGRIGVLTGGNGSAAKSADEIGHMGAEMMRAGQWAYDLDAAHFRAHFVGN